MRRITDPPPKVAQSASAPPQPLSGASQPPGAAPAAPTASVDTLVQAPSSPRLSPPSGPPAGPQLGPTPPAPRAPGAGKNDAWKLRFEASHAFTRYARSDLRISSTRYDVRIHDYEWAERGSRDFFLPSTWAKDGNNPMQVLDEPSNTFTLSLERNNHQVFLSAFHPKYFQAEGQVKHIQGTIDGTPVDHVAAVNAPFDGYNQTPGESEIVRNQNTGGEMQFELGYGYRFTLADHPKLGSLTYRPALSAGIMTGTNFSAVIAEDSWWDFEEAWDAQRVQGFGGSISNRLEWNTPRQRFGLFYEHKLSGYRVETGFLDGTQSYNLGYRSNNFGMLFLLFNSAKQRK